MAEHGTRGNRSCVETASLGAAVAVRDSKDPDGPKLVFAADQWRGFTCAHAACRMDRGTRLLCSLSAGGQGCGQSTPAAAVMHVNGRRLHPGA